MGPRSPSAQFLDRLGQHPWTDNSWRYRPWRQDLRELLQGFALIGIAAVLLLGIIWLERHGLNWMGVLILGGAVVGFLCVSVAAGIRAVRRRKA